MKKEVLLFTAGLDSYIAREYLIAQGHDIDCLYFNHSGRYCDHEIEKISELDFQVIIDDRLNLKDLEESDAHIPNRNILFTTLALSLGYKKVWLGGSLSDRVGDNKPEVYEKFSKLLTCVNEEYCRIDSPFYHCYKDDMVKWFIKNNYNKQIATIKLIEDTFSCFNPIEEHGIVAFINSGQHLYKTKECLNCSACFRKCAVLHSGEIFIPFKNKDIVQKYKKEFSQTIIKTPRTCGTLNYISDWNFRGSYGEKIKTA